MTITRIKDNSPVDKDVSSRVSKLVDKIADKTLEQLARKRDGSDGIFIFPETIEESEDISEGQMILKSDGDANYRSGNVMGFIGYGKERLIIGSRFSGEGKEDFFFQYLLAKVFDVPNIVDSEFNANQNNPLFNFFLFLFPYHLKMALRKGLYKEYILCKYNDMNVKGTIDIARHIQKNTPFIGNIAYNQREFSFDNNLTELVRHTIEFIKRKPYGKHLLSRVKNEVNLVVDATQKYKFSDRQKIIEQNKKKPVRHAYYKEYLALQRLCLLILRHQKHDISSKGKKIYGVLFDGAWLWEGYVNTLIRDEFHHPMNRRREGYQYLFTKSDDEQVGKIYPDFISKNDKDRIIADAKYKPIENIGKENDDYFQILAYMYRFDAKTGYFLYPEDGNRNDQTLRLNSGSTYEKNVRPRDDIKVIKLGLTIPNNASDYKDFAEQMQEFEGVFTSTLMSEGIASN